MGGGFFLSRILFSYAYRKKCPTPMWESTVHEMDMEVCSNVGKAFYYYDSPMAVYISVF